jgi:hypothetical protein
MDKRKSTQGQTTIYQRGDKKPYIRGHTTQWTKEKVQRDKPRSTKGVIRNRTSEDIQHNGQKKKYKGTNHDHRGLSLCTFSFVHCVVCPLMYGFLSPLW